MKKLKPYLSYWSKGYQKIPNKDIINWHKLSSFLCMKHYGEVHFVTDSYSVELFKDIKFNSVSIIDNNLKEIPDEYNHVWSLGKMKAFSFIADKGDPFLHVDYDVFLWKKLPEFIEKSEIFVQNKEVLKDSELTYYEVEKMLTECKFKNFSVCDLPDYGFNNGIFGGKDLEFIKAYCDSSFEFVMNEKNKSFWTQETKKNFNWKFAVLAEQWYLACYAKIKNKKVTCLFDVVERNVPLEKDCNNFGYTHLWGSKTDPIIIHQLQKIVDSIDSIGLY